MADQKERYLLPLLAGDVRSAFSMTEPGTAGSDPTLLETRASTDGEGWTINGHSGSPPMPPWRTFSSAVTEPDARLTSEPRCCSSR
jgi:acyl-CoA dehydrogenase